MKKSLTTCWKDGWKGVDPWSPSHVAERAFGSTSIYGSKNTHERTLRSRVLLDEETCNMKLAFI